MWGAIIGAATGLATSVAGGILGGVQSSKARKRAARVLDQQEQRATGLYNREYNQDYTQTASAQNALRKAREIADDIGRKAEGQKAIMGGTDESVASAKAKANQIIADTTASIAEQGEKRRDQAEVNYQNTMRNIDAQRYGFENASAQAAAQAGGQVMQAGMNLASNSINMFGLEKKRK